ncbi:MAG: hypothetical protein LBU89_10740 [Fibromonadaceae bacterium]|nr:hypothetical protein [Fibromonadaceae bacterium]
MNFNIRYLLFAITALMMGCVKSLSEKTTADVEQVPAAAWPLGVPDVRWYSKNPDDSVFSISTAEELDGLAQIVNGTWEGETRDNFSGKTIKLVANIDLSGYENWIPIGSYGLDSISVFSGTFSGGGHVISKISYDRSISKALSEGRTLTISDLERVNNYLGLFGYIRKGRVEDLGLDSVVIWGDEYVGGIAGRISDSSIIANCHSFGRIFGIRKAGGIAGMVDINSSIINSYSSGWIYGSDAGGGVAGYISKNSNVSNSYSTGNVEGTNNVGGVVGKIVGNSSVTGSFSTSEVEGYWHIGGVAGNIRDSSSVANCYSTGFINGSSTNTGGVAGLVKNHSSIISCYSTSLVSGSKNVGGIAGMVSDKSSVTDCVALNPTFIDKDFGRTVKRVIGFLQDATLSNNVAYAGITNSNGYIYWPITNAAGYIYAFAGNKPHWADDYDDYRNGADFTTVELLADGTLGNRFKDGWTTEKGSLPGLRGEVVALLPHLHKEAQTEMFNTSWYTVNPKATKFTISTASELAGLAQIVNGTWGDSRDNFMGKTIMLTDNIDLSQYENWVPIGSFLREFSGTFDGGGHVISNLTISNSLRIDNYYSSYKGLFGYIRRGNVKNIGLENVSISGRTVVGAVVGKIEYGSIANSYSTGTISGSSNRNSYYSFVGGIAGDVREASSITNSYSAAAVSGRVYVGGIAGSVRANSSVTNSYSTGAIIGMDGVGGIAGGVEDGSRVANCSALNSDVESAYNKNISVPRSAGRVVGCYDGDAWPCRDNKPGIISNNVAFVGMEDEGGTTYWANKEANGLDGTDITAKEIHLDGLQSGGQFTAKNGWTTEKGKLPGLNGKAVEMPKHLRLTQ